MKKSPAKVSDSEFTMWRAVFALAHIDGMVTGGEIQFMAEALEDVPFSPEQHAVLNEDIKNPKKVPDMFRAITDPRDQARFFKFAHDMVWADGDYTPEEQKLLLELKSAHIRSTNIDELVGKVNLEFEDTDSIKTMPYKKERARKTKDIIFSFRDQFLKSRFKD